MPGPPFSKNKGGSSPSTSSSKDLAGALKIAVDYTLESIRETTKDPKANWYGVNFESAIPMLVHSLGR